MIQRLSTILTIAALLFLVVLLIFAAPSFLKPSFRIVNRSGEPIHVVAEWLDEKKEIGEMVPMAAYEFSVNGEAAMTFRVSYADGVKLVSEPIYFSSGTRIIATINRETIKLRYE